MFRMNAYGFRVSVAPTGHFASVPVPASRSKPWTSSPRTGRITAATAPFTIVAGSDEPQPVVISQGRADTPQWIAATRYERALCWLSQGRRKEAVEALEASYRLTQNPAVGGLLQQLRPARTDGPAVIIPRERNQKQEEKP